MNEDGTITVDMGEQLSIHVYSAIGNKFCCCRCRRTYFFSSISIIIPLPLLGEPILDATKVPTTLTPNFEGNSVVEQTLECNGKTFKVSAVSMGNPHAIIFVDDLENDIDFESDGPALEACVEAFPARTNVSNLFVCLSACCSGLLPVLLSFFM